MGGIIAGICIVPFILFRYKKKQSEKNLLQNLQLLAKQQNTELKTHNIYVDFAIGLDTRNQFLFFYKKTVDSEIRHVIYIKDIEACSIKENTNRLYLSLIPKVKTMPEYELEFFNYDKSYQLHVDKNPIETWEKIISERIK